MEKEPDHWQIDADLTQSYLERERRSFLKKG